MTYPTLPDRETAGAPLSNDAEAIRLLNHIIFDLNERLTTVITETPYANRIHTAASADEDYTVDLEAAGTVQLVQSNDDLNIILDADEFTNFPIGSFIYFVQVDVGQLVINGGVGVTINIPLGYANRTRAQFSIIKAYKRAANVWLLSGDLAPKTQTISEAVAIDLWASYVTLIGPASSTYAITLAAPVYAGLRKTIEMIATTATNAVTLALTNVAGGSAATTATFDAAGETLVLESNSTKWLVMKEVGVTLS